MRRLTNLQIEHLTSRIDNVLSELAAKEIVKLGKLPVVPTYTDSEKLSMIRSGKAKLREDATNESHYHTQLSSYFVFPETAPMKKARILRERYNENVNAIRTRYDADKWRLHDQAILGDSTEALQMLQALELKLKK